MDRVSNHRGRVFAATILAALLPLLAACAPEVGSELWCQNMGDKPKGDWTANEAADYAKHCVFKLAPGE